MEIEVYTGQDTEDREAICEFFHIAVERELRPVSGHIIGVEVHLDDEIGHKRGGDTKRCVIVAQLEGRLPMSATQHGTTFGTAVDGACERLNRMIEHALATMPEPPIRSDAFVPEPA